MGIADWKGQDWKQREYRRAYCSELSDDRVQSHSDHGTSGCSVYFNVHPKEIAGGLNIRLR